MSFFFSPIRLVLKMFDNSNNTKEYYKNCWGTHGWKSIQLLYFEDVTNASEYINGGVDADEQRLLMFDPLQKAMIGFSQRHRLPLQRKTFSLSFRHTRFFVFMFVQGKEFQRSPLLSPNKIISYATEFCHQLQPPSTVKVEEEANANETPSTSFNLIDVLVTALSPSNVISIHNMLKCVLVVSGVVLVAGSLPSLMTTIINWMQTKPMSGKVKATTGNNNTMQDEGTLQQQTDDLIMKLKDELETEVKERDMGGERDTTLSVPDKHKHTNNINNINNINNKEKDKDMNNKGKDKCEADGIRTRKKKKKRGRKYSSSLQRRSRTTSETIEDNSSNECNRKKGGVQRDPVNAVGSKHSNNNNNNNSRSRGGSRSNSSHNIQQKSENSDSNRSGDRQQQQKDNTTPPPPAPPSSTPSTGNAWANIVKDNGAITSSHPQNNGAGKQPMQHQQTKNGQATKTSAPNHEKGTQSKTSSSQGGRDKKRRGSGNASSGSNRNNQNKGSNRSDKVDETEQRGRGGGKGKGRGRGRGSQQGKERRRGSGDEKKMNGDKNKGRGNNSGRRGKRRSGGNQQRDGSNSSNNNNTKNNNISSSNSNSSGAKQGNNIQHHKQTNQKQAESSPTK
eukprot:m.127809 g.127809  ORF g.127809 m.127809 type:complete len:619 (-) comp13014_c7_seq4:214-2070(-)